MTVIARILITVAAALATPSLVVAAELDRSAVDFIAPADIKWVRNAAGTNESAVLYGEPSGPATSTPAEKK